MIPPGRKNPANGQCTMPLLAFWGSLIAWGIFGSIFSMALTGYTAEVDLGKLRDKFYDPNEPWSSMLPMGTDPFSAVSFRVPLTDKMAKHWKDGKGTKPTPADGVSFTPKALGGVSFDSLYVTDQASKKWEIEMTAEQRNQFTVWHDIKTATLQTATEQANDGFDEIGYGALSVVMMVWFIHNLLNFVIICGSETCCTCCSMNWTDKCCGCSTTSPCTWFPTYYLGCWSGFCACHSLWFCCLLGSQTQYITYSMDAGTILSVLTNSGLLGHVYVTKKLFEPVCKERAESVAAGAQAAVGAPIGAAGGDYAMQPMGVQPNNMGMQPAGYWLLWACNRRVNSL